MMLSTAMRNGARTAPGRVLRRSFVNIPGLSGAAGLPRSGSHQEYVIYKKLNHPQELMYGIIRDVARYQEFIPYCTGSFINAYDDATAEPSKGGFRVGFHSFDEEFTCDLECTRPTQVISKSITDTLFKELYSEWNIIKLNDKQSEIKLVLRYSFKSQLYNQVSAMFATKISEVMLKAFEKRAIELRRGRADGA